MYCLRAACLRSDQPHFQCWGATRGEQALLDRAGLDLGKVKGGEGFCREGEELVVEMYLGDDA